MSDCGDCLSSSVVLLLCYCSDRLENLEIDSDPESLTV